jgi:hypothetical protein
MTMTREEYLEFTFKEHLKTLRANHSKEPAGTRILFAGFYGKAIWVKGDDGNWTRESDV